MKYILFIAALSLNACDSSSHTAPKIAAPQREALDKAKDVEQLVQKQHEESQKKISDAEEK